MAIGPADDLVDALGCNAVLSAPQQIDAHLRGMIAGGRLTPGDRLPRIDRLAEQFGVSAPTARRALHALREANVLSCTRGRGGGYRVCDAAPSVVAGTRTPGDAPRPGISYLQLYEVRLAQDVLSARAAALNRTDADLRALEAVLARALPGDPEDAFELDLRFHEAVARCTHNPLIIAFTGATAATLRGFPHSRRLSPRAIVTGLDAIAASIRQRDGTTAARAMRAHLRGSSDFFDRLACVPPRD